MIKKIFLPLLIAGMLFSCVTSKQVFRYKTPAANTPVDTVNIDEYLKKYEEHDAVYLESNTIAEHWGGKTAGGWTYNLIKKYKYLILNPESDQYSVFKLGNFKKKTVTKVFLNVYYPDGTSKKFSKRDLKKNVSDNTETWSLAYPNLVKGSIIEEHFVVKLSFPADVPPIDDEFALEKSVPVEKLSFTFAYPNWWHIQIKDLGPGRKLPIKLTHDTENKKNIYTYTATNIPAYKAEPYSPYWKEIGTYIQWFVKNFQMKGFQITTRKNWDKVADDFRKYAVDNDAWFSGRVKNTTEKLIKDLTDPVNKLDTIVTYVQKNVESKRSSKVSDFADVLKYKKGDPYMITGLTKLMLEKAGISSDFVMIHSAQSGYFDKKIFSLKQLPNPALSLDLDEKEYLIFPYAKYLDYRAIPPSFLDQPALTVPKKKKEMARLIQTPAASIIDNKTIADIDVDIDEDGLISVTEKRSLTGLPAFLARNLLEDLDEDELNEVVEEMLSYDDGEIEIDEIEIIDQHSIKKPLVLSISYTIDNLVSIMPDEVIFQTTGLFSPSNIKKRKFDPDKRQHPIKVIYKEVNRKNIVIRIPETWSLQSELKDFEFSNKYGSAEAEFNINNNDITVRIMRVSNRANGEKEEINDLMEIHSSQSKTIVPDIIFNIEG